MAALSGVDVSETRPVSNGETSEQRLNCGRGGEEGVKDWAVNRDQDSEPRSLRRVFPLTEQETRGGTWCIGEGPGENSQIEGFPNSSTPMPGMVSHTSCGKKRVSVSSVLCFFPWRCSLSSPIIFWAILGSPHRLPKKKKRYSVKRRKKQNTFQPGALVPVQSSFCMSPTTRM